MEGGCEYNIKCSRGQPTRGHPRAEQRVYDSSPQESNMLQNVQQDLRLKRILYEMSGTCSMREGDEKCRNFSRKSWREGTTLET
jgi:hypothetical protein